MTQFATSNTLTLKNVKYKEMLKSIKFFSTETPPSGRYKSKLAHIFENLPQIIESGKKIKKNEFPLPPPKGGDASSIFRVLVEPPKTKKNYRGQPSVWSRNDLMPPGTVPLKSSKDYLDTFFPESKLSRSSNWNQKKKNFQNTTSYQKSASQKKNLSPKPHSSLRYPPKKRVDWKRMRYLETLESLKDMPFFTQTAENEILKEMKKENKDKNSLKKKRLLRKKKILKFRKRIKRKLKSTGLTLLKVNSFYNSFLKSNKIYKPTVFFRKPFYLLRTAIPFYGRKPVRVLRLSKHHKHHLKRYSKFFKTSVYHPLRWSWALPKKTFKTKSTKWLRAYLNSPKVSDKDFIQSFNGISLIRKFIIKEKDYSSQVNNKFRKLKKPLTVQKHSKGSLKVTAVIERVEKLPNGQVIKFFSFKTKKYGKKKTTLVPFLPKKKIIIAGKGSTDKKISLTIKRGKRYKNLNPFIKVKNPSRLFSRSKIRFLNRFVKLWTNRSKNSKRTNLFFRKSRISCIAATSSEILKKKMYDRLFTKPINFKNLILPGLHHKKDFFSKFFYLYYSLWLSSLGKDSTSQKVNTYRKTYKVKHLLKIYKKNIIKILYKDNLRYRAVGNFRSASRTRSRFLSNSFSIVPNSSFFIQRLSKEKVDNPLVALSKAINLNLFKLNMNPLFFNKFKKNKSIRFKLFLDRHYHLTRVTRNKKKKILTSIKKTNRRKNYFYLKKQQKTPVKARKKSLFVNARSLNKLLPKVFNYYRKRYEIIKKRNNLKMVRIKKKIVLLGLNSFKNSKKLSSLSKFLANQSKSFKISESLTNLKLDVKINRLKKYRLKTILFHPITSVTKYNHRDRYRYFKGSLKTPFGFKLIPYLNKRRFKKKNKGGPSFRYQTSRSKKAKTFVKRNSWLTSSNKWFKYKLFFKRYLEYRFGLTSKFLTRLKFLSLKNFRSLNKFSGLVESSVPMLSLRSGLVPSASFFKLLSSHQILEINGKPLKFLNQYLKPADNLSLNYSKLRLKFPRLKEVILCRIRLWWIWYVYLKNQNRKSDLKWDYNHFQSTLDKRSLYLVHQPNVEDLPLFTSSIKTINYYTKLYNMC